MNVDYGLLWHSYSNIFTLNIMFLIFVGVTAGIVIGALPGLTATMGVALLIPLTFGRPPLASLSMLMGIYTGAMYGGAISAILIRTPGTPAAAATVLEGYPMCQKGLAGSAMAMSLFSSFVGGIIGCIIMIFMSPLISGFALEFGPVEYFALAIFGLSVIISISGRSLVKGVMVGFFGLLLASMGLDPISGYPRFTFGFSELMEGPNFIPTLIGLFAVSEVIANIEKMLKTQKVKAKLNQYLPSWSDIKRSTAALIKGSLIGTIVGAIPGAGGDIAAFIAYAETKRSSKTPELFGTGMVEGVAATESANNSCQGGAMIPLLSLGVPGDAVTAVLLGAFVIQGLQPGPLLYKEHMDLVYAIFASMVVAQFVMQFVGMVGMQIFREGHHDRKFDPDADDSRAFDDRFVCDAGKRIRCRAHGRLRRHRLHHAEVRLSPFPYPACAHPRADGGEQPAAGAGHLQRSRLDPLQPPDRDRADGPCRHFPRPVLLHPQKDRAAACRNGRKGCRYDTDVV